MLAMGIIYVFRSSIAQWMTWFPLIGSVSTLVVLYHVFLVNIALFYVLVPKHLQCTSTTTWFECTLASIFPLVHILSLKVHISKIFVECFWTVCIWPHDNHGNPLNLTFEGMIVMIIDIKPSHTYKVKLELYTSWKGCIKNKFW